MNNRVIYAPGTQQNHETLIQAGVYGMALPREYGGLNFAVIPYVMAAEIVSRADAGFANTWVYKIVLKPLMNLPMKI